jgi:hypothetical protein
VGFALWRQGPLVYCAGTHEYRPMGTAVVHERGVFTARDFSPGTIGLRRGADGFVGYFASLSEVNAYLGRRAAGRERRNSHRVLGTF